MRSLFPLPIKKQITEQTMHFVALQISNSIIFQLLYSGKAKRSIQNLAYIFLQIISKPHVYDIRLLGSIPIICKHMKPNSLTIPHI